MSIVPRSGAEEVGRRRLRGPAALALLCARAAGAGVVAAALEARLEPDLVQVALALLDPSLDLAQPSVGVREQRLVALAEVVRAVVGAVARAARLADLQP